MCCHHRCRCACWCSRAYWYPQPVVMPVLPAPVVVERTRPMTLGEALDQARGALVR